MQVVAAVPVAGPVPPPTSVVGNAACRENLAFTSTDFGAWTDDDVNTGLHIGIARLADARYAAIEQCDIGLDDAPMIQDQRIGNHGIDRTLCLRALRLAHAVAYHLAAAEFHFLAEGREITLDFDEKVGIGEPDAIPHCRAEHVCVGAAWDACHGEGSVPMT